MRYPEIRVGNIVYYNISLESRVEARVQSIYEEADQQLYRVVILEGPDVNTNVYGIPRYLLSGINLCESHAVAFGFKKDEFGTLKLQDKYLVFSQYEAKDEYGQVCGYSWGNYYIISEGEPFYSEYVLKNGLLIRHLNTLQNYVDDNIDGLFFM